MAFFLSNCERPAGGPHFKEEKLYGGGEGSECLMSELDELVKQHCDRLGRYLDGRLAVYHGQLLQSLGERAPHGSVESEELRASASRLDSHLCSLRSFNHSEIPTLKKQVSYGLDGGGDHSDVLNVSTTPSLSKEDNDAPWHSKSADTVVREIGNDVMSRVLSFEQTDNVRRTRSKQASLAKDIKNERGRRRRRKLSSPRSWADDIRYMIESTAFEAFICMLILSNVVLLGVEVEMLGRQGSVPEVFKVVEFAYTLCFAQELAMRVFVYGPWCFLCGEHRAWNFIDMILVAVSVAEHVLKLAIPGSSFAYARTVRILRTARVFRVVRIMKFFRPLRILVHSVVNTMRSLMWTLVLLAMIIYSFAIMFTMACSQADIMDNSMQVPGGIGTTTAGGTDATVGGIDAFGRGQSDMYFGSLWASVTTLFLSITGGMDWEKNTAALNLISPIWGVIFMAYIAFSHLAFVNVVTGVVCQGAIESAQQDQEIRVQSQLSQKQTYIKQLEDLFRDIDADRSGTVTLQEFEDRLYDDRLQEYFAAMDLTTDEAWNLFKLLDSSESCLIDIEEFVSGCLRLRGTARSVDMHMLMYQTKWTMKKLSALTRSMEDLRQEVQRPRRASVSLPLVLHSDRLSEVAGAACF